MPRRSTHPQRAARSEKLDLRLTARDKSLLKEAAKAERRSVSDFVVHSALLRAEEMMLDRKVIFVDTDTYDRFVAALDAPPRDIPRLKRLLSEPGIFDQEKSR